MQKHIALTLAVALTVIGGSFGCHQELPQDADSGVPSDCRVCVDLYILADNAQVYHGDNLLGEYSYRSFEYCVDPYEQVRVVFNGPAEFVAENHESGADYSLSYKLDGGSPQVTVTFEVTTDGDHEVVITPP